MRLPRDYHARLDSNDYFVHPSAIGRRVEVSSDSQTVAVTGGTRTVAVHDRCWARRRSITDPEHAAAAEALRTLPRAATDPAVDDVEQRSLADYDGSSASLRTSPDGPAAKAAGRDLAGEVAFLTRA